ncbi:MAG: outer membrane protein assembly factor BamC [Candidatus Polarisedimenticolaceae bacterium]|nr:outer membrane protein assembly factor BamC [Candidatus Polarisedimenticolaceae bacterium]
MFVRWTKILAVLMVSSLTGCSMMPDVSKYLPDRKVDYKKEKQAEENLEIPPDLTKGSIEGADMASGTTSSGAATYSDYVDERKRATPASGAAGGARVLPRIEDITVKRDGDQRWLVVRASADEVWHKIISFWQENKIPLLEQNPLVGIMRTRWIEHRADSKTAATRDQYRVRLEEGEETGVTEVYLTHRGMEQQFIKDGTDGDGRPVWAMRPADHGLEAEMLRRMMLFFGLSNQRASQDLAKADIHKHRSELLQEQGQSELEIAEEFPRAWRIIGIALDRGGFAVEDRDRAKGIYYVRYNDPTHSEEKKKGILSKLAFWRDDDHDDFDKETQYQVKLQKKGEATRVTIQNDDGVRSNSDTAKRILVLLHEQIK